MTDNWVFYHSSTFAVGTRKFGFHVVLKKTHSKLEEQQLSTSGIQHGKAGFCINDNLCIALSGDLDA